uniref:DUF1512 domain-containing protein n=1 Tax=uncultured marine thaumarchaeote KM3_06_C02 TaxID=1455976 RepID=A0A075G517_9ARCH|nr:hypothetical protein conserved in archaea [uncultured marine thaumarchaeote KM3_06_C02]
MIMLEQISLQGILNMLHILMVTIFFLYGQKIQLTITLRRLGGMVLRLERMRDEGRYKTVETLSQFNNDKQTIEKRVDRLLNFFIISPVSLDPKGIIRKIEHQINNYDDVLKQEVVSLSPAADKNQVNTMSNLLEVSSALDMMHRIARHFYISGKNKGNILAITQLQIFLPMILDAAEAYHSALNAFCKGLTIGDGFGPLVASNLMKGNNPIEIAKDTVFGNVSIKGRKALVVKAKGPGGNVGKPGEAIKKLVESNKNISLIITVDAALKFEGEDSGEIAEGTGAAIGGPGVERYKIEGVATEHNIPLEAVIVKMSQKDAISEIKPQITEAVEKVIDRITRIIEQRTRKSDTVVIAGIGNTLGIT